MISYTGEVSPPAASTTTRSEGSERERGGVRGARHVILGFRVATTCDGKKFDNIIKWGSKSEHKSRV